MGTAAYMKLGTAQGLPYKTTLLGGRLDVGQGGIAVFGAFWALAATGFLVSALAIAAGWTGWRPLLLVATLVSLVLTALDAEVAYAGVIVNVAILAALWLSPLVPALFVSAR